MAQSRKGSFVETLTSTAIGLVVSAVANYVVMPTVGCQLSLTQNIYICVVFTAISIVRGFLVRRLFNSIGVFNVRD